MEHVGSENFKDAAGKGKVLIDFYAEWCGPCKRLTPILEELEPSLAGQCAIKKMNIDECGEICSHFRITSVPTMLLLQDGQEVGRLVGLRNADEIRQFVGA